MCGIAAIATINERDLISEIVQSLIDLEYRGYDSAGVGILDGRRLKTYRVLGSPSESLIPAEIRKKLRVEKKGLSIALGHNRWATHGKASVPNAHPHEDCTSSFAVVHNGTISNYAPLRTALVKKGHQFKSDTDTEVIVHSIEEAVRHERDFIAALALSLGMLQGSYALVIVNRHTPDVLYVAKKGSPLHVGMNTESFFVSSSTHGLIRYTDKHISLADDELMVLSTEHGRLTQESYNFKNKLRPITKQYCPIGDMTTEDLNKGTFRSFMEKEIHEQPDTFAATIMGRYAKRSGDAVLSGLSRLDKDAPSITHLSTVACGTAHHAGLVANEVISRLTSVEVISEIASEYKLRRHSQRHKGSLVLAISQSGETADTLEAVREAKRKHLPIFSVVNVPSSTLTEESDFVELTRAGIEVGVASTKAYTAQLAIMYLIALKLARESEMSPQGGKAFIAELERIPDAMRTILENAQVVQKIAKKYSKMTHTLFLGRNIHLPSAQEAALKLKELTYREAGAYPMGELKHGPIAIIDAKSVSFIIMPKDELYDISKQSVEQIHSKGGKVVIITDESARDDHIVETADDVIFIPTLRNPLFYPLIEIIPLQLLALYMAESLGKNVDQPRNLAKSVTVE